MRKPIPAVSIIIPVYNAEKYIGECLDSILAQTFTDYEVIVVDDCSTDKSCDVVENYLPKFNKNDTDKLQLVRSKKNSGAPGVPNNIGLNFSRGEYISFIEADDMITKTALEELYPIAKKFDADVVHCEKYLQFDDGTDSFQLIDYQSIEAVKEPTLISEDFAERVRDLYRKRFIWNVWSKLIRRNYILENNLKMIDANMHDAIYTCCLVCSAKRYVRVPNVVNLYRIVPSSMSHVKQDISKTIRSKLKTLTRGFDYFNKFLDERDFFQKHPDIKHLALEIWVRECCQYLFGIFDKFPAWKLYPLIYHELENVQDKTDFMAYLFCRMNNFNVELLKQNSKLQQVDEHIQKQNQIIQQLQSQVKN